MSAKRKSTDWNEIIANKRPTPDERLEAIARQALAVYGKQWDVMRVGIWSTVSSDIALMMALFEPFRVQALQKLIARVAHPPVTRTGGHNLANSQIQGAQRPRNSTASQQAAMGAVGDIARKSLLDTFIVNGQPIGDLTPREASGWVTRRKRDARFVELLIANLPLDEPIRKYRRDADTAALAAQAEKEVTR